MGRQAVKGMGKQAWQECGAMVLNFTTIIAGCNKFVNTTKCSDAHSDDLSPSIDLKYDF